MGSGCCWCCQTPFLSFFAFELMGGMMRLKKKMIEVLSFSLQNTHCRANLCQKKKERWQCKYYFSVCDRGREGPGIMHAFLRRWKKNLTEETENWRDSQNRAKSARVRPWYTKSPPRTFRIRSEGTASYWHTKLAWVCRANSGISCPSNCCSSGKMNGLTGVIKYFFEWCWLR